MIHQAYVIFWISISVAGHLCDNDNISIILTYVSNHESVNHTKTIFKKGCSIEFDVKLVTEYHII